uniref:Nuclear pore complex protein n=2 Tax=Bionectria ochroleuca TaxID=29856 RepID=A0A0B7KDA5_BIOOC
MASMELDIPLAPPVEKLEDEEEGVSPIELGVEFEQFANSLDDCLSPHLSETERRDKLLDIPRKYYENATKRLEQLEKTKLRRPNDDVDMDTDDLGVQGLSLDEEKEIAQLEREVQTWDLLRRVLPLRHPSSESKEHLSRFQKLGDRPNKNLSLDHFFQVDPVAAERRAVLQWLQNNAASGPDIDELSRELQQNADRGDIISYGWLHTRSAIKMKKGVTGWPHLLDRQSADINKSHITSTGAPLVTQLDPDAPSRQGRKLQPQDEYFERAIWLGCFEHLRRGSSLDKIREWCQERTELWRAVSTSALLLPTDQDAVEAEADPLSLALWRRMCYSLARQGGSDDYERAVYGLLSGDISSVEKVATKWDDYLFAHYNALLRTQIDTFLLSQCDSGAVSSLTTTFPSFDAIQFHGDAERVERRLVRSIETQSTTLRYEAFEPNKALQASIVAKDVDEYLFQQGESLGITPEYDNPSTVVRIARSQPKRQAVKFFGLNDFDGLRIVGHVYVLVTLLDRLDRQAEGALSKPVNQERRFAQESIIALYTDLLRRANLQELIPLYCSILDQPRSYRVLSQNLIHIRDYEQRLTQLKLIKKATIDVIEFVTSQANTRYQTLMAINAHTFEAKDNFKILAEDSPSARLGRGVKADFFGDDDKLVENQHEEMIRALEWLLMVDETWALVFSFGVNVYKYFLKHMHLLAARRLMERVSFHEIMQGTGLDDDDEAMDRITFWSDQLKEKNITSVAPEKVMADARNFRELESLVRALDSLETIGSLVEISADIPPNNREYWGNFAAAARTVKESMEPLLKNWLLAGIQSGDGELNDLRQVYLPETVLAYVSALHIAGTSLSRDWLLECMQLAAVVAERDSDLEGTFIKAKRVKELLEAFAACSKALAITTGDKRAASQGSKKLREMGWSRDLWSVKSS